MAPCLTRVSIISFCVTPMGSAGGFPQTMCLGPFITRLFFVIYILCTVCAFVRIRRFTSMPFSSVHFLAESSLPLPTATGAALPLLHTFHITGSQRHIRTGPNIDRALSSASICSQLFALPSGPDRGPRRRCLLRGRYVRRPRRLAMRRPSRRLLLPVVGAITVVAGASGIMSCAVFPSPSGGGPRSMLIPSARSSRCGAGGGVEAGLSPITHRCCRLASRRPAGVFAASAAAVSAPRLAARSDIHCCIHPGSPPSRGRRARHSCDPAVPSMMLSEHLNTRPICIGECRQPGTRCSSPHHPQRTSLVDLNDFTCISHCADAFLPVPFTTILPSLSSLLLT